MSDTQMFQHIHQIFHSDSSSRIRRVPHRDSTECTITVKENAPFKLPTKHCLSKVYAFATPYR